MLKYSSQIDHLEKKLTKLIEDHNQYYLKNNKFLVFNVNFNQKKLVTLQGTAYYQDSIYTFFQNLKNDILM